MFEYLNSEQLLRLLAMFRELPLQRTYCLSRGQYCLKINGVRYSIVIVGKILFKEVMSV
jgi:hypothetical protein